MEGLAYCLFCLIAFVPATNCLNLGLMTGDLRRTRNPPIIQKFSYNSPLTIYEKWETTTLPQIPSPISPRRLFAKPSALEKEVKQLSKRSASKHKLFNIPKLRKLTLPKLPLSSLSPILPFIIPKLPLLPLPLLPIIPPLPLLSPILPSVPKLLKPLRVPIICKGRLKKGLGSELKPISIPSQSIGQKKNILQNLLNLKNRGTLTAAQILRLKKVLL